MIGINNHKTLIVLATISTIAAVLTGSVHMAFAQIGNTATEDVKTTTKTTTNSGVNVPTDTDQKQQCDTAGGTSPITTSCTATSTDTVTQSGGVLKK